MTRPSKRILALPLEVRAEMALKAAVRKVIEEHARLGLPLYLGGRDGKAVKVSAKKELAKLRRQRRQKKPR